MKTAPVTQCMACVHAQWERTAAGKLHPSKSGRCAHPLATVDGVKAILPACIWHGGSMHGGYMSRDQEDKRPCPCREVAP